MNVLLRLLGIELLSRLAKRLPGQAAWWATLVLLVGVNLLPIAAVVTDRAGVGDVFLVFWWENVVVWLTGIVRIETAEGTSLIDPPGPRPKIAVRRPGNLGSAAFFAIHYGAFTMVHGAFTFVIIALSGGLKSSTFTLVVLFAAIAVSHLAQLGLVWFGRGERNVVSPLRAMFLPYPRMIVMQVAVLVAFFLVFGGFDGSIGTGSQTPGVVVLCVLKLLIDIAFHLGARKRVAPTADNALYGAAEAPDPTGP
jgi:hypothetical protein